MKQKDRNKPFKTRGEKNQARKKKKFQTQEITLKCLASFTLIRISKQ